MGEGGGGQPKVCKSPNCGGIIPPVIIPVLNQYIIHTFLHNTHVMRDTDLIVIMYLITCTIYNTITCIYNITM